MGSFGCSWSSKRRSIAIKPIFRYDAGTLLQAVQKPFQILQEGNECTRLQGSILDPATAEEIAEFLLPGTQPTTANPHGWARPDGHQKVQIASHVYPCPGLLPLTPQSLQPLGNPGLIRGRQGPLLAVDFNFNVHFFSRMGVQRRRITTFKFQDREYIRKIQYIRHYILCFYVLHIASIISQWRFRKNGSIVPSCRIHRYI